MALDLLSTVQMLPIVEQIKPQTYLFRDRFFSRQIQFATQAIAFEALPTEQRPAPYVSPQAQGRIMSRKGRTSKLFQPAYVKPKHELDPNSAVVIQRGAGEPIAGNTSTDAMANRWNAEIARCMQLQLDMIDRREEIMAANAIINGSLTVASEDYPAVTVDYGRDPSLTLVLTGTAAWGQSAAAPLTNIRNLRRTAFGRSSRPISDVIMGLDAFDLFFADPTVQALMTASANYRLTTSDSQLSSFSDGSTPLEYRGRLQGANGQGALNVWTYAQTYEDYDGTTKNIMNPLDVVGVPAGAGDDGVDGFMCYGAIKDSRAGLRPLSRFPKMWEVEDPSVTYMMTQSSPLPVICRPNATFRIRVSS
jgi:hypothetical protein